VNSQKGLKRGSVDESIHEAGIDGSPGQLLDEGTARSYLSCGYLGELVDDEARTEAHFQTILLSTCGSFFLKLHAFPFLRY